MRIAIALSVLGLASLAHADVSHPMIEIGAGAESSSQGGGVNVLLRVSENFTGEPAGDFRIAGVLARLNADIAISPYADENRVPYVDIDFSPVGFAGDSDEGGLDLLPMKITRDVRLGNGSTLRIDAIDIWYDGEHTNKLDHDRNPEAHRKLETYSKFAIAALGYRMTSFIGHGKFSGFDLGSLEFEGGLLNHLSAKVSVKAGLGGTIGVSFGQFENGSGTESVVEGSLYAEAKADIGEFVTLYLRGAGRMLKASEAGYTNEIDFQFMSGAIFNLNR